MAPRPPDFLCIGAARAGTTWLYRALAASPGYWMPPVKELRYFGKRRAQERDQRVEALIREDARASDADVAWVRNFVHGEPKDDAWYFGLFADANDRLTGDISPSYAGLQRKFIEAARETVPHATVIMLVRNPVDRDLSHALLVASKRVTGSTKLQILVDGLSERLNLTGDRDERQSALLRRFDIPSSGAGPEVLLNAYNRETGENIQMMDVLRLRGMTLTIDDVRTDLKAPIVLRQGGQSLAIEQWRSVFGDRFHVFLFDDLISDPAAFLASVTDTLGRRSAPADDALMTQNVNPSMYDIDGLDALRTELRDLYADEVGRLVDLLGPRVSHW